MIESVMLATAAQIAAMPDVISAAQDAETYANQAASSAQAAAASGANALEHKNAAEGSAQAAAGFAGEAETAQGAAKGFATAAASSATAAQTAAAALQDTGWRDVSSLLINGWTVFAGQTPRIRRTNGGLVFLKGLIKPPPLGEFPETRWRALEIPIGFRPDRWNEYMPPIYTWAMPATVLQTRINNNFLQVEAADTNKFAGVGWAIGGLFWFTADPWPTTLPGTPA